MVFSRLDSSFLFICEQYSIVRTEHSLSLYLLKDFSVSSKIGQQTPMCRFVCRHVLSPLKKHQATWLLNHMVGTVPFRKKLPNSLPKWLHYFVFHQQWVRVPIAPHPHQHMLLLVFCILAILRGIRWYVVLICISLMTWCWACFHVLIHHLCIFFGEVSAQIFFPFLINLFVFLLLSLRLLCIF